MVVAKYPASFGHNTVINNLCHGLNKLGYKTAIGAFSFDSDPPHDIEKIKLNEFKLLRFGVNYLPFDIIHSHQPRVNYFLLLKKPTKPIIMHVHGASNIIHKINYKFSMFLFRKRISRTIAVSNTGNSKIKQMVGDVSTTVVYNGVNTTLYTPNLPSNYKKGNPQLLFVGGLRKYKNAKILIYTMSELLKIHPNAHLQIVGDGIEFKNVQNLITKMNLDNHIELIGKILNEEELKLYYSSCDVYVSASSLEACPVPPFEAMSCGKPLVLYGIDAHKEIIELSNAGEVFNSLNPTEICKKISDVFENKKILGINGRKFVEKYSWDYVCNNMVKIYENVLSDQNLN